MFAYCRNEPIFRKDSRGTDDVCVALCDDYGNPLNDLGGTPTGNGGTYHYSVDLSIASRSSLLTGGIHNCGYSAYGYTTGPSFSSTPRTGANTQKFIPNPNGRKGGEAHQTTIANVIKKYSSPRYKVRTEAYIPTPNGIKSYRFADIEIIDQTNGQTTYINVGKQLKSGAPCAREARAIADISGAGRCIKFVAYN